ncbi:hypothetical protein AB0M39_35170 [Streptomyces sp. NPDC051907]|uniref:hypothetical protein n=1 Tax=Streptomyces sp. NPDC051907 TaxID=3155284 RepID=UPI00341E60E4
MTTPDPLLYAYWNRPDDALFEELFRSDWSTPTLAYMLASQLSPMSHDAKRCQFLAEYETEKIWCRGDICRALLTEGVTLQVVNYRKS